jgi:hypothetical protein
MSPRALKMEFWLSALVACSSAACLGFLLLVFATNEFPGVLIPFVNRAFGRQENAAVAADLGIKVGLASLGALFLSLVGLVHYHLSKRKVVTATDSGLQGGG